MNNKILKELKIYLSKSDNQKSSHWQYYLEGLAPLVISATESALLSDYSNIYKDFGIGTYTKKKLHKIPIHNLFQRLIFGNKIFKTKEYHFFKKLCHIQNRQLDLGVMKHAFTFNLLNRYNIIKKNICIIGDEKASCVGGLLTMNKKDIKIFSINLTEALILDYLMIRNINLIDDDSIIVVNNEKDLENPNKKLFLIDASNVHFLKNKNINLFININSMQEMRTDIIENYFQIIKSNSSYFYCCNREYKKLIGGEELIFNQYPWGDCKIIVWENCFWYKKYYDSKYPFIKKYDGNIKHALVKYL